MRGEWIEIPKTAASTGRSTSLPMRGEWIEMHPVLCMYLQALVSPRVGRVD